VARSSSRGAGKHWVGFDLGGTKMLAIVFDHRFHAVSSRRRRTKPELGARVGLARIAETIGQALEVGHVPLKSVAGIGIGCPGPLDLDRGVLLESSNLAWRRVRLKAVLEKEFGCPVTVANDVDAGVYGEYRLGAAQRARCVLGVFPGTGIGGGCVYEGRILRGKVSSCMEIGHCQVLPNGPRCGCGRYGCLETVASRLSIGAALAAAAARGQAPHLLAETGTDLSNIRSGAIAVAIQAGDGIVEQIVRDAARWIGVAVGNVANLLAPDVVVLGGGLVEAMPVLFREEIESSARRSAMQAFERSFHVVVAQLGDQATAAGAAAWAQFNVCGGERPKRAARA
jgi:glucokinase